jgi:hypothetical protein
MDGYNGGIKLGPKARFADRLADEDALAGEHYLY